MQNPRHFGELREHFGQLRELFGLLRELFGLLRELLRPLALHGLIAELPKMAAQFAARAAILGSSSFREAGGL